MTKARDEYNDSIGAADRAFHAARAAAVLAHGFAVTEAERTFMAHHPDDERANEPFRIFDAATKAANQEKHRVFEKATRDHQAAIGAAKDKLRATGDFNPF
jgi:hypothetical protein